MALTSWAQESGSTTQAGSPAAPAPAKAEAPAPDAKAAASEQVVEEVELSNWIDLTIGGPISISGDEAAFQRRTRMSANGYGGIESMRYERIMDDVTLLIEGHALFGVDDYDITLSLIKDDVGFLRGGFRHFRTFYDASGGWVPREPGADFWVPLVADEQGVDRGSLWFEAGLRMENVPQVTLRYAHDWRDGVKDSTIWSSSRPVLVSPAFPAVAPNPAVAAISVGYGIVPTLNHINEVRDTIGLDIEHTIGNTDLELGFNFEFVRNDDVREIQRAPRATAATDDRDIYQRDIYDTDLFNTHFSSESRLNDQMLLSFGYSFTTMNTETTGSQRNSFDRTGARRFTSDHFFDDFTGGAEHEAHVANANFWWNPFPDLVIVPSIRAEWEDQTAVARFKEWTDPPGPVTLAVLNEAFLTESEIDNLTEQLEIRYTGIDNLVLYSKAEYLQSDRDLFMDEHGEIRDSTSRVSQQKYVVGANWYPIRGVSVATQYYRRNWEQEYDHQFNPPFIDRNGAAPPAANALDAMLLSHDFNTDDVNARVTWRVLPNLTLVGRYDYQDTEIETRGLRPSTTPAPPTRSFDTIESAHITRHVFSASATWAPVEQAYVQAGFSLVEAGTDTPADQWAPRRITDFDNNYFTANLTLGCALDSKTTVEASYLYYHSNNFEKPNFDRARYPSGPNSGRPVPGAPAFPGSVPFGSDADEHLLTVSLNRRVRPNMIWSLGYGFYTSTDGMSGGHNNFTAHTLSTGVKIRF